MMKSGDFIPGIEPGIPQQPLVVIQLHHGFMHQFLIHATVAEWYNYQRLLQNFKFDSLDKIFRFHPYV